MRESIAGLSAESGRYVRETVEESTARLRDEFAMAALQGIVAVVTGPQTWNCPADARLAYEFADAMMEARKHGRE